MSLFKFSPPSSVGDSIGDGADGVEWFNELARRARIDYEQMPGLSLTPRQAGRLWKVSPDVSQRVLSSLVEVGYLKKSPSGFVRTSVGLASFSRGVNCHSTVGATPRPRVPAPGGAPRRKAD
jgi:hypothetical protein